MKKILTSLALVGAVVTGANAQRNCDLQLVAIYSDTAVTINCVDSFAWGYIYVNNGPDAIVPGDTMYFIDHNAPEGQVFLETGIDVPVGDTVINWSWNDHYDNVIRLVDEEITTYLYDAPFANGVYNSPILFAGFADTLSANDTTASNDGTFIGFTIDCVTGINDISHKKTDLNIFPNPSNGQFSLNYNFITTSPAAVRVTDVAGRVVLTKDFGKMTGVQTLTVDASSLSNGIYNVELVTDNTRAISKLTISK